MDNTLIMTVLSLKEWGVLKDLTACRVNQEHWITLYNKINRPFKLIYPKRSRTDGLPKNVHAPFNSEVRVNNINIIYKADLMGNGQPISVNFVLL